MLSVVVTPFNDQRQMIQRVRQEAQLSQRDRAMHRVIKYFAESLKSLNVIRNGTSRKLESGFLFAFHSNYGCILYHSRDDARYWPKMAIFFILPAFNAPTGERVPVGLLPYGLVGKTRMVWLSGDEKKLMICLAVSTECRRVTDRQDRRTDGQTDIFPQHSPRYA